MGLQNTLIVRLLLNNIYTWYVYPLNILEIQGQKISATKLLQK